MEKSSRRDHKNNERSKLNRNHRNSTSKTQQHIHSGSIRKKKKKNIQRKKKNDEIHNRREKKMKVKIYNDEVEYIILALLMDDEIREKVHNEIAPCTEQEFINRYIKEHEKKYKEKFQY